jgi:hypothetical protein
MQQNGGLCQLDLLHDQVELGPEHQRHLGVGINPCRVAVICGYANLERVMTSFHRLLEIQFENVTGMMGEGSDTEPSFARNFGRKTMNWL